jgi:hypothetical protein
MIERSKVLEEKKKIYFYFHLRKRRKYFKVFRRRMTKNLTNERKKFTVESVSFLKRNQERANPW